MDATTQADLLAARTHCETAVEAIMAALDRVSVQARKLQDHDPEAAAELRSASLAGIEACAFQDIVGQILERLGGRGAGDPLLHGPSTTGHGLDQAKIDDLMASMD